MLISGITHTSWCQHCLGPRWVERKSIRINFVQLSPPSGSANPITVIGHLPIVGKESIEVCAVPPVKRVTVRTQCPSAPWLRPGHISGGLQQPPPCGCSVAPFCLFGLVYFCSSQLSDVPIFVGWQSMVSLKPVVPIIAGLLGSLLSPENYQIPSQQARSHP